MKSFFWSRLTKVTTATMCAAMLFMGCSQPINTPSVSSSVESAEDVTSVESSATMSSSTESVNTTTVTSKPASSNTVTSTPTGSSGVNATTSTPSATTSKVAAVGESWGKPQKTQPGLYVEDGVIKLAGKPFYGFGTNYYDAVLRPIVDPLHGDCELGIKHLAEYGFPYVRARFSAWGSEGMYYFWSDRETFFAATDHFVRLCEKYNIGIIATLVWTLNQYKDILTPTYADVVTNKESAGYKKMLEYCEAIVTRYKNSPAIWGWEIGNEFNLDADMNTREETKGFTTKVLSDFYTDLSKRIHKWDGTNRMITSGNSQDRGGSYNQYIGRSGVPDSLEELEKIYRLWNPGDLTVTSIHVYNRTQWLNKKNGVPVKDYLAALVDICKKIGKPLYIGEYCDDEMNNLERTEEVMRESLEKFQVVHDAIVANDIQLAVLWIYWDQVDPYVNLKGHKYADYYKYMMDNAKKANESFVSQGKQDTASYWKSVTKVVN